jgi:hypothetical protein
MSEELEIKNVKITERPKIERPINVKQLNKTKKVKMQYASALKANYCRYCNRLKEYKEFQVATNPFIDKNGYLSICNSCLKKIFNELYHTYNDYNKAFYAFCQHIDIIYDEGCISEAFDYLRDHPNGEGLITKYWRTIKNKYREQCIRYRDTRVNNLIENKLDKETTKTQKKELKFKWGDFTNEEYEFLESIFDEYSAAYGINGPNERDGYKTLAILLLRQRSNPENREIITAIKAQYELLGIDPKQLRKENREKGSRTLGLDISTIEKTTPAEYIEDKKLYFDYDGLEKDLKDLTRAQKNHLTGSRDFTSAEIESNIPNYDEET